MPPGRTNHRPAPPTSSDYSPVMGGLVSCRRCAALLLDVQPARDQHDGFHAALRRLWDQAGGRPGNRP